jgi:hypothetical protein
MNHPLLNGKEYLYNKMNKATKNNVTTFYS